MNKPPYCFFHSNKQKNLSSKFITNTTVKNHVFSSLISSKQPQSKTKKNMISPTTATPATISPNPQPTTLFIPNGIKYENGDDIELISIHALTYTSLRDILPPNRSQSSSIMSPTDSSSWYEVPIKNPLVKQAALSYLQPMSIPPESDDRGFLRKLKDKCCCTEFGGCFAFFTEVVVWKLNQIFSERNREFDDDDDYDYDVDYVYDDDDEEDEDDDKID